MNARLRSIFRPLTGEHGQALPMVLGMMVVFSISITSVIIYTSSSQKAADSQKKGQYATSAAEAALATAISVLSTTTDPTLSTSLPACTGSPPGTALNPQPPKANGFYCGSLSGMNWTITATGVPREGAGNAASVRTKTITQVATVSHVLAGGLGPLWDRMYQYDDSKCTEFKKIWITVPVVTRGCLKLSGDDAHPTRILNNVTVGGVVTLKDQDSIGTSGTPIARADIAGTCTLEHGSGAHSPCSSLDRVYAGVITNTPTDFARPTVSFAYWYANAKPGPMQNCTYGSLQAGKEFDKNTTYNGDADSLNLLPKDVSYTCQVWSTPPSSGTLLGELSWDAVNQVLTIHGTIFFDGDIKLTKPGGSKACHHHNGPYCDSAISYNGRGTIYASKKVEIEAGICAGGDGTNDCELDPGNWDPTQNTLLIISGGTRNIGDETFKMEKDDAVFQGAVWSQGKCKVNKKSSISAPLICGQLAVKEDDTIDDPTINPWPASLIGASSGQVWPTPPGDMQIILQPQLGG